MRTTRRILLLAALVATTGCGGSDAAASSTTTTTSVPPTSAPTTTLPPTTSTTPPSALEELGYPVSDDWVVETVVRDVDSGAGGLAIDAEGYLYIGDWGYPGHDGDAIHRIGPDGAVEVLVESDLFDSLTMTALGPGGRLYQSSYATGDVFVVEPDGSVEAVASGLGGPTGLVILEDGSFFVEAYDRGVIHKVLPDGRIESFATSGRFRGINGLTQGPDGTLYAVNHQDGGLFSITGDGTVEELHRFPAANAHVAYLDGSLFVTSRGSYVVYRWDLEAAEAEIIAGSGEPGDQDGRGGDSAFGRPNAITVGQDGALYINHGEGRRDSPVTVRRITYQP